VDPDPLDFTVLESRSALGMRIRVQEHGNSPKLRNKPDFLPAFVLRRYVFLTDYLLEYIFYVKIQL
jgi:hypothetical protein